MVIIGITGTIGSGKSVAAAMLARLGCAVYNADAAVHALLEKDKTVIARIARLAPGAKINRRIDRKILGRIVFGRPTLLKRLEAILHPKVRRAEQKTIAAARKNKRPAVVLDIPLLFETGGQRRCDATICLTAKAAVRRARVMKRKGMTDKKYRAIMRQQFSDAEKRRLADYVVRSDQPRAKMAAQLKRIFVEIMTEHQTHA